jgi:hypothetical protein
MQVPRTLNKSRRPKAIPLTAREAILLMEQLLARTAGTSLVFPNARANSGTDIASAMRCGNRRSKRLATSYCRSTCSDTRPSRSCVEPGIGRNGSPSVSGHSDGGALVLKRYRHRYPSESYAAAPSLDALVAEGNG